MSVLEYMKRGWSAEKVAFTAIAGLTMDVDASLKVMTRSAGSFITDGIEVGQRITWSGFASGGNNNTFEVTAVDALTITHGNATGLVNVTDDTPIGVHIGDIRVRNGRSLLGRLRVLTASDDVTPYDDDSAMWDVVDSVAELEIGNTPLLAVTSLRVVCATPAEAWVFYKEA